jgi:hypothetical protein
VGIRVDQCVVANSLFEGNAVGALTFNGESVFLANSFANHTDSALLVGDALVLRSTMSGSGSEDIGASSTTLIGESSFNVLTDPGGGVIRAGCNLVAGVAQCP